ncbi:OprO/OprP family phosphate-selective porin [Anaeromyxobacter oryzae]|uniref:Porin domain-containing protein n=1 Tax=Anaeromyxobacter oryzae TaxID=2918170 RepID=A0ABN6MTX9_9BACT|nr:OprO/OprP family phosphate-selective porin [Anaeromyxobacter oryzae]BDG03213.1 hypothetical protein AMOR_22090 [Anaeromyxobacter oryzae]
MRNASRAAVALALLTVATPGRGVELAEGKLSVAGFGEWAFGETRGGGNRYVVGTRDGNYQNAELALAVIARPDDSVVVASQLFMGRDGEVDLDWAFVEWRPPVPFRVRLGKIKQPFGALMELKDVGTVRPFFTLPQSVYGPAHLGAEAYLGAGLTGDVKLGGDGYALDWDLYGGAMNLPVYEPFAVLATPPPWTFPQVESELARNVVGARLTLATPVDGLVFRVSGYTGTMKMEEATGESDVRLTVGGLTAEYVDDRFTLRAEAFGRKEGSFEDGYGAYVDAGAFVTKHVQVAVRAEVSRSHVDGIPSSSTLLRHDEAAVGANYWFTPDVVFKLSYHLVYGNRFATPDVSADGVLQKRTELVVAGTQFSF